MYLNFYHLKKEPFQNVPDPEFLFLSPGHREALATLVYGVEQRKGFITIIGEAGVGKTSILRYYLERVTKQNLKTIYIFYPNLTFGDLLKTILHKQGIQSISDNTYILLNQFHQILIDHYKNGNNVVLIIDEAQNMPIETLENLRMLSNLETTKAKLIQIVLVGQPELDEKLQRWELRQLRQRIAVRLTIPALARDESMAYIKHRLAKASLNGSDFFTSRALRKIIAESRGIPRLMNILCDNALITGLGYQKKTIDTPVVKEVISDFKGKSAGPFLSRPKVGMTIAVTVVCLILALSYIAVKKIWFADTAGSVPLHSATIMPRNSDDYVESRQSLGVLTKPQGVLSSNSSK